jgi:hypothetical protein
MQESFIQSQAKAGTEVRWLSDSGDRKEQKEGRTLTITVPRYKSVPVEIIKSILHQAKMSRERYFQLLKQS